MFDSVYLRLNSEYKVYELIEKLTYHENVEFQAVARSYSLLERLNAFSLRELEKRYIASGFCAAECAEVIERFIKLRVSHLLHWRGHPEKMRFRALMFWLMWEAIAQVVGASPCLTVDYDFEIESLTLSFGKQRISWYVEGCHSNNVKIRKEE